MKGIKIAVTAGIGTFLVTQQAFAGCLPGTGCDGGQVPEIDGGGAIIAISLIAGLVALVREKFFKK